MGIALGGVLLDQRAVGTGPALYMTVHCIGKRREGRIVEGIGARREAHSRMVTKPNARFSIGNDLIPHEMIIL